MAEDEYKRLTCAQCQVDLDSKRKKKYCGVSCKGRAESNPSHSFRCEYCGKESHRRPSTTMIALGYPNRWCSMACRVGQAAERKTLEQYASQKRQAYKALLSTLQRLARLKAGPEVKAPCTCAMCGTDYQRVKGQRHNRCVVCVDIAKAASRRNNRLRARKNPKIKVARLMAKAIRRAKEKIECQSIDPIRVFERDRWRCKLCGIGTPRRLRGSYDIKAPELDHVVPLSLGGGHTWANVQCACRACNIRKGAMPLGQIGFGFPA